VKALTRPTAARRSAVPRPHFDVSYALAQSAGDASALAQLADLFRAHAPAQLGSFRGAIEAGDAAAVARAAHTLKGSTSVFLARERLGVLHEVERLAKQGRLAEALGLLPAVESLVADLTASLERIESCDVAPGASA
jgi:HPt (histidine-containing phosphotransfer) domain-containing protein